MRANLQSCAEQACQSRGHYVSLSDHQDEDQQAGGAFDQSHVQNGDAAPTGDGRQQGCAHQQNQSRQQRPPSRSVHHGDPDQAEGQVPGQGKQVAPGLAALADHGLDEDDRTELGHSEDSCTDHSDRWQGGAREKSAGEAVHSRIRLAPEVTGVCAFRSWSRLLESRPQGDGDQTERAGRNHDYGVVPPGAFRAHPGGSEVQHAQHQVERGPSQEPGGADQ